MVTLISQRKQSGRGIQDILKQEELVHLYLMSGKLEGNMCIPSSSISTICQSYGGLQGQPWKSPSRQGSDPMEEGCYLEDGIKLERCHGKLCLHNLVGDRGLTVNHPEPIITCNRSNLIHCHGGVAPPKGCIIHSSRSHECIKKPTLCWWILKVCLKTLSLQSCQCPLSTYESHLVVPFVGGS